MTAPAPSRREWIALAAIVAAVAAFYATTLRDGQYIGSDATLYILHARNIAEGVPYAETGYLFNPYRVGHSPPSYPPLVPVALAPLYAAFGLDVEPMKLALLPFFLALLLALWCLSRPRVGQEAAFAIVILVGCCPYFWQLKDEVLAEFPLLCFTYLALWYGERFREPAPDWRAAIRRGVVLGLLIYLACAAKSVAVLLLPSLVAAHWLRTRRLWPGLDTVTAGGVSVALLGIQALLLAGPDQYAGHAATISGQYVLLNLVRYPRVLIQLAFAGWPSSLRLLLAYAVGIIVLVGWVHSMRRRTAIADVFVLLVLLIVGVFPGYQGPRYLVPILPLLLVYAVEGARALVPAALPRAMRLAPALVMTPIALSFLIQYRWASFGPLPEGFDRPEIVALANAVKAASDTNSVVITIMPRTIALIARRKASIYAEGLNDADQWRNLDSLGATHLIIVAGDDGDQFYLRRLIRRYQDRFEPLWRSELYALYRIRRTGQESSLRATIRG